MRYPTTSNPARSAGFTLMELLITIAIIGILAAIAYPSYLEYTRRSERANARVAMNTAAQWMERQYTASNTATGNTYPTSPAAVSQFSTSKYTLTIAAPAANSFTLQADTVSGWADPKCGSLTLTNVGVQGSAGTESTTYCWAK